MPNTLVKFLSAFIPGDKARRSFRNRMMISALSKTNDISICPEDKGCVRLSIVGKDNVVKIGKLGVKKGLIDIRISGNGNRVELGDGIGVVTKLGIVIGQSHRAGREVTDTQVCVGSGSSFQSAEMTVYTSHSKILVGQDCMFSFNVNLYHTDGHPIFDRATQTVCNRVGTLEIGNHVWVGAGAKIMKNAKVPDDCIVGMNSVVTHRFDRPHTAIAGNPARCVTKDDHEITWDYFSRDYVTNTNCAS